MEKNLLARLEDLVSKAMGNDFSHGYPHIVRVRSIAWDIVDHIGIDIDGVLLDVSILLHDLGRLIGEPHAYYSALFAKSLLQEHGLDKEFIDKVVNAILYHSYNYSRRYGIKPLTEEAKILSDADKLDALGVVGFLRVFHYSWLNGRSFNETIKHFYEKIFNLYKLMHYPYTRAKAIELTNITKETLNRLLSEISTASEKMM